MKGFSIAPDDISTGRKINKTQDVTVDENIITDPTRIRVILMHQSGKRQTLNIPYLVDGTYFFLQGHDDDIQDYVYIMVKDGRVYARCYRPAYFKDDQEGVKYSIEINEKNIHRLEKFGEKYYLCFEKENNQSNIFCNYHVTAHSDIVIGNRPYCDLVIRSKSIADSELTLSWKKGGWIVSGNFSSQFVSVNNGKGKKGPCVVGDVIDFLNLRIVLGPGFLAINDADKKVVVNSQKLRKHLDSFVNPDEKDDGETEEKLFNRFPRKREALVIKPIIMEAPPISLSLDSIPLLLRMGSPLVMSSASLLAGNITAMLSSVLFPVLTQKYTDKQRKEYEEKRTKKYNEYLSQKQIEINNEITREEEILNRNYPEFSRLLTYADSGKNLWERRKTDDDFLTLRLGHGNLPMLAECDYPRKSFDVDDDPLVEKMYSLVETQRFIKNVPIMSSFIDDHVCGVLGSRRIELDFVKRILIQLVLLHSYDEVKVVFLLDSKELEEFSFIKYIPHIWTNQKDFRFLATNTKEASQISEFLQKEIGDVLEKPYDLHDVLKTRPYYFVFALDKRIFESMEILKEIMQADQNCGISILTIFDDLPKECVKIFDLQNDGNHSVVYLKQIEKEDDKFNFDTYEHGISLEAMNKISNIRLKMLTQSYALPKMVSFLEMFDVGKIEQLNPIKRWRENNPVKSLATPVGVDTEGDLFYLDLHEKYQGPHGLVAGMTGSGKSEFIITYILSMAVNYHPDEVAFILIDYKGGGLAGAFEDKNRGIHLPHLVGTITNLDGSAIQRSLMSIQSELKRRQQIFNEAKSLTNEGTMDIYTYQKLYRNGMVAEPLPHLFIISDEFAELKAQEPDFMDQLISAARIGRSLGVHLILATQKPAGVVNDQIWSNTKFRVCLKVQDRGDSIEMLKRPEAAELKDTGRFYLQVGYNEYFALGQSAWCGAPYMPQEEVVVQLDDEVQFVDSVGQTILKTRPENKIVDSGLKQIVVIVKYLSELAKKEGIEPKSLWQEPLESCLDIEKTISKYNIEKKEKLEIPVGIVDDPYRQRQYPYVLEIQKGGNVLIVGTSGSGKTTFIQTVLYMLSRNYTSDQVNYYIFDFSSRTLNSFKNLPHCGCILMDENEGEVEQVVAYLEIVVEERKALFSQAEVSSYDAYVKKNSLPMVMLIIDNLTGLDEFKKGRDLLERITNIMRNGSSYGIRIIASISNLNDCLYRMQHEFGTMIALQANDKYAYSNILNVRCQYHPAQVAGRGMCAIDGEGLELQICICGGDIEEQSRSVALKEKIAEFGVLNKGLKPVIRIENAKTDESFEEFCELFSENRLPLGYNLENGKKVAIPFQQLQSISVFFGNKNGITLPLKNILYAARKNSMKIFVVKRCDNSVFETVGGREALGLDEDISYYRCDLDDLNQLNNDLISMIKKRTEIRKKVCVDLGIGASFEEWSEPEAVKKWRRPLRENTDPVLVLFESMLDLELNLSPDLVGKYQTIFNMCIGYNMYFMSCSYPEDIQKLRDAQTMATEGEIGQERRIEELAAEESPEEAKTREIRHAVSILGKCFNKDEFCLLFGGMFDCQNLVSLPYEYKTISVPCKPSDYNRFLMNYRGSIVKMQMPMEIEDIPEDIDEMSII